MRTFPRRYKCASAANSTWSTIMVIAVAAGIMLLPAGGAAALSTGNRLEISTSASRAAPQALAGARILGASAIFVPDLADTRSVSFYLDGAIAPFRVERSAPYDLGGTGVHGAANLVGVSALGAGTHRLSAVRSFGNGAAPISMSATFTVGAAAKRVVTICGVGLCMDGRPWRINGGSTNGNPNYSQTPDSNVALAVNLRVNTLRLTDFIAEPGQLGKQEYEETQWVAVDGMIARAAAKGLKVELDLATYRNFLMSQSSSFNPYTYDWTKFLVLVANRINTVTGARYGSDSTIAFVSFAGESGAPDNGDSLARGVTASQLVSFYDRVMTLWGTLAPGQIRIPGGLFFLTDSTMPWRQIFALSSCDLPAIHSYSVQDEQAEPAVEKLARSLGKPWILEEFGFSYDDYSSDAARAAGFLRQYDLALSNGAAGVGWWNIDPAAIDVSAYPRTIAAIQAKNSGTAAKR